MGYKDYKELLERSYRRLEDYDQWVKDSMIMIGNLMIRNLFVNIRIMIEKTVP